MSDLTIGDVGAVTSTSTTYATRTELQNRIFGGQTPSATDNSVMDAVIEAVSRAIDNRTGRRFDRTAATRVFTAEFNDAIYVPDLVSIDASGLLTDEDGDRTYENTWATTDFDLMPFNAPDVNWPYTQIGVTPDGDYTFPKGVAKGVKITGTWGWPAVPDAINEACLIWSERLFKRKDSPFGVAGNIELGILRLPRIDPDVDVLLWPFVRQSVGAVG